MVGSSGMDGWKENGPATCGGNSTKVVKFALECTGGDGTRKENTAGHRRWWSRGFYWLLADRIVRESYWGRACEHGRAMAPG